MKFRLGGVLPVDTDSTVRVPAKRKVRGDRSPTQVNDRIQQAFARNQKKMTSRASRELFGSFQKSVSRLTLLAARGTIFSDDYTTRKVKFCEFVLQQIERDDSSTPRIVFSDEAAFYTDGEVNLKPINIRCGTLRCESH